VLAEATVGEPFEVRLDITNVAVKPGLLVRIEGLFPSCFRVMDIAPKYKLEEGTVDVKGKGLQSRKVESIKMWVTSSESGIFHLSPKKIYVDDAGKFKVCQPDPMTVTVYPSGKFEFKMNNAERVFEYLTQAFIEDYMRRRLTVEKSGWRTFMEIIRKTKISKACLYGTRSRRGPAILELEKRGIVEVRIFPGERGRGGKIMKARVSYEKDIVKRHIDRQIMKKKEK